MKGYELVAAALADEGVGTLFGVVGDANLFVVECLVRAHDVRYVQASHEAAAVMMALGHARVRDAVGFATTTHGPGMTNTFTALVEGVRSNTPLIILVGDTDPARLDHHQDINQRAVAAAAEAGFEEIRSLETAAEDINRAVWRARVERRPIVLNLPTTLNWLDAPYLAFTRSRPAQQALSPDPSAMDEAVGLIASASRPIVLAGRGALSARASLLGLADRLGAPVATTLQATGLFRGEPYDLGVFGQLSHPVAAEAIAQSDCVVAFGASLNRWTTDEGNLLTGKRVVQCDVAPDRFGPIPRSTVEILGDAEKTADAITGWLKEIEHAPTTFRERFREPLAAGDLDEDLPDRGTQDSLDPRVLTRALDRSLPRDRTVAVDLGRFMHHALKISVPEPSALVTTHQFGSMGLGTAAAIGAGIGRPHHPVVLLAGDGGFMMGGLAEFHAAVRYGIDLIVVLYNDGTHGAEFVQLYRNNLDPAVTVNNWPDFTEVARSMGGEGLTLRRTADLDGLAERVAGRRAPLLIDARLDPEVMSSL